MTDPCEPVSTFNKRPFCSNHFELCNLICVLDVNNIILSCLQEEKAQITLSKILISSNISLGCVTGLKNSSFNAIKVFKTTVAHRCHGNILKHRRNHSNIKRQHAATYALGLHGHFKSSRQQLRISRRL